MAGKDVTLDLIGRDKTGAATTSAGRNFDQLSRKVDQANTKVVKKTGRTSRALDALGVSSKLGAAAVVYGAFQIGKSWIKAGSEQEQAVGGVESVFKKYADTVEAKAAQAADKYGLSATQYENSAALIGASLKNQGVSLDKLGPKTDAMIKRGADLAATYGGTAPQAVDAMTSALKGEFDPLERYGISLKQTTVNAEAMRVAHVKTAAAFNRLSPAQQAAAKSQATMNLIMRQSKDAAGQVSREMDTNASKTARLKAKYADISAEIGGELLPAWNKVLDLGLKFAEWSTHGTAMADAAIFMGRTVNRAFEMMLRAGKVAFNGLIGGVERTLQAFAEIPGPIGRAAKQGLAKITSFKAGVNKHFDAAISKLHGWDNAVNRMQKEVHLKAEKRDLDRKIEAAKAKLKTVPKERRAELKAKIDQLQARARQAQREINALHGKTVSILVKLQKQGFSRAGLQEPVDRRLSSTSTWSGAAGGGTYRTGGATPTIKMGDTNVHTRVLIDGNELRAVTRSTVVDENKRAAWHARVGRR